MPLKVTEAAKAASAERVKEWNAMTHEERQAFAKEQAVIRQAKLKEAAEAYAAWLKEQQRQNEPRRQAFIKDLRDLLTKYGADISANCEGDTYGIHDETIGVYLNVSDGKRSGNIPAIEVAGWSIDAGHLK